jgi:predicted alpha/beta-hydrolase family hydrolase
VEAGSGMVIVDEIPGATHTLLFAHGAGAPMDHPWMTRVARGMAEGGVRVIRFEFPYMAARRTSGKRAAPDRQPVLLDAYRRVIEEAGGGARVVIGGKSMGGRMASMVADEMGVRGLVCFGYPFHPPGQPEKLRTAHLASLRTSTLILQGTRDPFGTVNQVSSYTLSHAIRVQWLADGGHSLEGAGNVERAIAEAVKFIATL